MKSGHDVSLLGGEEGYILTLRELAEKFTDSMDWLYYFSIRRKALVTK